MTPTIAIEIPASRESQVRRFLALIEELDDLAASAPDGTVLDACEAAVIEKGRDLSKRILADAVARRVETAEKRGHRSADANAAGPRKTAAPRTAKS
jgi:hypothetical protein